ncbi:hypothetical protein DB346_21430 [Verrucomicrobia bacterium LW23]|nr:hypothetical protein DB346_21430 [Verrucomicrobia bacterium LW23]
MASRRRGAALIISLGFVVILTIIVVAFLSRATLNRQLTESSGGQMKADHLARAASDFIVGDIKNEITAGSYNAADWPSKSATPAPTWEPYGKTIYPPRLSAASSSYPSMRLMRIGVDSSPTGPAQSDFPYNLVRRSSRQVPLGNTDAYVDLKVTWASEVNSEQDPSSNGGFISKARWNKPLLMSTDVIQSGNFQAPDWVILTRGRVGASEAGLPYSATDLAKLADSSPSNPDFAIGRFAYTVYDVGGLLDVNLAGHVTTSTGSHSSPNPEELARKGGLGLIDLRKIPGILDPSRLVVFRNEASAKNGAFTAGRLPSPGASDYAKYVVDPSLNKGFSRIYPGDQTFLSRQDLLVYASTHPDVMTSQALEYLTTFSRDINGPSWSPINPVPLSSQTPVPTLTIDYRTEADADRSIATSFTSGGWKKSTAATSYLMPYPNRNLLRAQWSQDRTIRDWDGNDVKVLKGSPIVARRFPLSRLDLFRQYYAASGAEKAEIQKKISYSFGLSPDPGMANGWVYDRYSYVASKNVFRVLTVDEMDAAAAPPGSVNFENREPNFFELIRAGILRGDLGNFTPTDDDKDSAIMTIRIGANIIDQYDSDSYPTMIYLNPASPTIPFPLQVAGIENLPYISEITTRCYRKPEEPLRKNAWMWLEFELWNPHSNPGIVAAGEAPDTFRVVAFSGTGWLSPTYKTEPANIAKLGPLAASTKAAGGYDTPPVNFSSFYSSGDNAANPYQVRFTYPGTCDFRDPTVLGKMEALSATPGNTQGTYTEGTETIFGILCGYSNNVFGGNQIGWPDVALAPADPYRAVWNSVDLKNSASLPSTFTIEFQDKRDGNRWVPYQGAICYRGLTHEDRTDTPPPGSAIPRTGGRWNNVAAIGSGFHRVDPRGTRFRTLSTGQHDGPPTPGWSMRGDLSRGISIYQYFQNSGTGEYASSLSGGPISVGTERFTNDGSNYERAGDLIENRPTERTKTGNRAAVIRGRDSIMRPADGNCDGGVHPTINTVIGSGRKYLQNVLSTSASAQALVSTARLEDRPVMLDRPFQSVGEMAYAFRDMPWKTINFSSSVSAEAALFDLFCVTESSYEKPVLPGSVNLNSVRFPVLKALLAGTGRDSKTSPAVVSDASAEQIATDFFDFVNATPMVHRSDAASAFYKYLEDNSKLPGVGSFAKAEPYPANKERNEAVARALGGATNTRTWNLMIDVIAQSGRYPKSASSLKDFYVTGEQRYWIHIAIDRFTGEVVDRYAEAVAE